MRKVLGSIFGVVIAATLALSLSACSTESDGTPLSPGAIPTVDPSLIPSAPADLIEADPSIFDVGYSEYAFKVGVGPTWCTINTDENWALCEENEAAAEYQPIPTPDSCQFSYGYQVRLWGTKPAEGETAEFVCNSGYYTDPSTAQTLNSGEQVSIGDLKCFVVDVTARCENTSGQYIALGPKAWALKSD